MTSKKQKNKQDYSKPWLIPGVIKSITLKNIFYKQFCEATDPAQRVSLH